MGSAALPGLRRSAVWRGSLCGLLALAVIAFAGCGSSSTSAPTPTGTDNLVTADQISKRPPGSVERSFLGYWSSLQYRSWADSAAYYDPRLREFIGTAAIIGAKKGSSSLYPLVKPEIARVDSQGGKTTVFYNLQLPDGSKELDSITWQKNGGNWQILYDSRLDSELGQLATNRAEVEKTGALPTGSGPASPEAVRAGRSAEEEQARFLEKELKISAP